MRNPVVVDKRVAGIVRWLERLKNSYSEGAMEVALMDAECARADLEDLRQDVFINCSGVKANPITKFFAQFLRSLFLAVLIVMLMVVPISRENISAPVLTETESNKIVLAEPIIIIRESKPEPIQPPRRTARRQINNKPQPAPERTATKPAPAPAVSKKVPYEQVLSLMQTGQRALKGSKTVIINNK